MANHPNLNEITNKHNAIYEAYYKQVDPKNIGTIEAMTAAKFLKKSGLSDVVLSRIWDLSDPTGRGYLDKHGLFIALKLVALAQAGHDMNMRNILMETTNPPKVGEIPKIIPQGIKSVPPGTGNWSIKPTDKIKYEQLFESLQPVEGLLPGNKVRSVLMESKLQLDSLSKIWDLADQDRDGSLDKHEFVVAMHLVYQALDKKTVPSTLPPELERKHSIITNNNNNSNGFSTNDSNFIANFPSDIPPPPVPPLPANMPTTLSRISPAVPMMPSLITDVDNLLTSPQSTSSNNDWVITPQELSRFNNIFRESDADMDGLVSGLEIKDVFLQSGIAQICLAQIWSLCDTNQSGKLTSEQFALAMWFVERKKRGIDPPQILAPNMIPPSLRLDNNGGVGGSSNEISLTQTESQPAYTNPELEMISKEIEELAKERRLLETDVAQKEADIRIKTGEIRSLQSELDTLAATLKQLENQKGEAQKRLDDLKNQVNKIREQCQKQEETIKEQETELDSKRGELQKLKDEESSLEKEYDTNRNELENLTIKLQDTQLQICQVKSLVSQLIESQRQMNDALTLCKEAIDNNDPSLVYDYSLKLNPDFRDAKNILLSPEATKSDPFNEKNTGFGKPSPGFTSSSDPFTKSISNNTNSTGFDDNFNATTIGFDDGFGNNYSNKSYTNDPFAAGAAANTAVTTAATVSPAKNSTSDKDEFGSDPFAILHAPTSSSQILSAGVGLGGSQKSNGGPPPRPESPSPALPPKKAKQPPPRPAPPRPSQGPTPVTTSSDFAPSTTTNPSGFADFADFDNKTNASDFTEDPFKDYRYEDPFSIQDPFEKENSNEDDEDLFPDNDLFDSTTNNNNNNNNDQHDIKNTTTMSTISTTTTTTTTTTTIKDNFKMDFKITPKLTDIGGGGGGGGGSSDGDTEPINNSKIDINKKFNNFRIGPPLPPPPTETTSFFDAFNDTFDKNTNIQNNKNINIKNNNMDNRNNNNNNNRNNKIDAFGDTINTIRNNLSDINDNFEDEFSKLDIIDNNILNNTVTVNSLNNNNNNNNNNKNLNDTIQLDFAKFDAFDMKNNNLFDDNANDECGTAINKKDLKNINNEINNKSEKFASDYSKTDAFEDDLQTVLKRSLMEK